MAHDVEHVAHDPRVGYCAGELRVAEHSHVPRVARVEGQHSARFPPIAVRAIPPVGVEEREHDIAAQIHLEWRGLGLEAPQERQSVLGTDVDDAESTETGQGIEPVSRRLDDVRLFDRALRVFRAALSASASAPASAPVAAAPVLGVAKIGIVGDEAAMVDLALGGAGASEQEQASECQVGQQQEASRRATA